MLDARKTHIVEIAWSPTPQCWMYCSLLILRKMKWPYSPHRSLGPPFGNQDLGASQIIRRSFKSRQYPIGAWKTQLTLPAGFPNSARDIWENDAYAFNLGMFIWGSCCFEGMGPHPGQAAQCPSHSRGRDHLWRPLEDVNKGRPTHPAFK